MKYGTYSISLSIGYSNADREGILDVADYYTLGTWERMTEDEQQAWIDDMIGDILGQYIEYGCELAE